MLGQASESFAEGILEVDTTATSSKKKVYDKRLLTAAAKTKVKKRAEKQKKTGKQPKPKVRVRGGRLLLFAHRQTKRRVAIPLPDKVTAGNAPEPPETVNETKDIVC